MKRMILELPCLTTPRPKEDLYLYLAATKEALRRYFEAHPVKVITDQPIKQILSKAEAFRRLAKYTVELGAYNITYLPKNAIKGQVLAESKQRRVYLRPPVEF